MDDVFAGYSGSDVGLERTKQLVEEACGGSQSCLVCLDLLLATDPVWQCGTCYALVHSQCILQWVSSAPRKVKHADDGSDFNVLPLEWACPKCRASYDSVPDKYTCFCGAVENPAHDPWITPHTCGSKCIKELEPACGHACVLQCHPGPCPPCPQMVATSCHCGASKRTRRCNAGPFSCEAVCGKALAGCGHPCERVCHTGPCPPCEAVVADAACVCGREQMLRACATLPWQCEAVCGEELSCGRHACTKVCHSSSEPHSACPGAGVRTCPCGKSRPTSEALACDEAVPTCGDTCGKALECGLHTCFAFCHEGPCPPCDELVSKKCECKATVADMPCSEPFRCSRKCARMRSCGRHVCKAKCCPPSVPCKPCTRTCERMLRCGNHKCGAPCHDGPCFPCPRSVTVSCACGAEQVSCGHECSAPCHHPATIQAWEVHVDTLRAELRRDAAAAAEVDERLLGTLDVPAEYMAQVPVSPACPPCSARVMRGCVGGHVATEVACSAPPVACANECGAELRCGHHTCTQPCHPVAIASDRLDHGMAESRVAPQECPPCTAACEARRRCGHPHVDACHRGECPPCEVYVQAECFCGGRVVVMCGDRESPSTALSCGQACERLRDGCGHLCSRVCHPGECNDVACEGLVVVRCRCGATKASVRCGEVPQAPTCGEECRAVAERAETARKAAVAQVLTERAAERAARATAKAEAKARARAAAKARRTQEKREAEARAAKAAKAEPRVNSAVSSVQRRYQGENPFAGGKKSLGLDKVCNAKVGAVAAAVLGIVIMVWLAATTERK
ncbi:NF-X1-type zinc finger protein NFXL1 [Thecamonas trahens ATCC 50062]|uniref:NF-X1-type zinc finger protein NFXL1 n=1 Tax=Thecamonas trahens ATCC 50062 TaxID=461836 RepID=A0A0L0DLA1_THETB|nr:NF-X1-type zinc finger protein NFXL1 [Thecamonas trahens ATCC 50062]KNC53109.1 NF-X1-type zinc finger protein NFXL1 [Thecamonas trahens ATCC 50062]|eukprot:XP_013754776.1 NF-X1-type zinc finger protein NFXL1 [Thecamonas trahens ATCC 50062]